MLGLQENAAGLKPAFSIPSVPVYWSVLTVALVAGATVAFWKGDQDLREVLNFLVLASAVGAGSLSAYYVWAGLKTSVAQRNEILREEKVNRAMAYLTRWNDGSNSEVRTKWLAILAQLEATPPLAPASLLADMEKRAVVASVLNFCEELGYAARTRAADMKTLEELFKGLCLRYYKATRPWIEFRRTGSNGSSKAWSHFEWLHDQWK
jgi:hypothetical protein